MTICQTDALGCYFAEIWMRENEYGAAYVNKTINLL